MMILGKKQSYKVDVDNDGEDIENHNILGTINFNLLDFLKKKTFKEKNLFLKNTEGKVLNSIQGDTTGTNNSKGKEQ
jgi:hypothetical protein